MRILTTQVVFPKGRGQGSWPSQVQPVLSTPRSSSPELTLAHGFCQINISTVITMQTTTVFFLSFFFFKSVLLHIQSKCKEKGLQESPSSCAVASPSVSNSRHMTYFA